MKSIYDNAILYQNFSLTTKGKKKLQYLYISEEYTYFFLKFLVPCRQDQPSQEIE